MTIDRRTWDPRSDLAEEAAKDVHGLIRRECPECGGPYIAHCIPCEEAANAQRKPPVRRQEPCRYCSELVGHTSVCIVFKARSETAEERQARELADLF